MATTFATNRIAVLRTYRHLLRATRIAFQARLSFREAKLLESGGAQAAQSMEHAQGVTKILREHVVQGRNVGGETYKVKIHEHTQKLENERTSLGKGTTKSFKEIKDAQF